MVIKKKIADGIEIFLLIGIIIFTNIIASQYFFRIDLSEDKRYSISSNAKEVLKELNDVVYVEVYLEGEFPAGFQRLQKSIRETLDEFRIYGGQNIQYKFINPGAISDEQARSRFYMQLAKKGIQPTNLFAKEGDKKVEKLIFPGAIVTYKEKEVPVMFLKGNKTASPGEILNQSVEGVEYELISSIRQLTNQNPKSIAFVEGHGELSEVEVSDITASLREYYNVYRLDLSKVNELDNYDALIIARPQTSYSEKEKFLVDQFIVNGGKVLFFIDPVKVSMDSIAESGTMAVAYNHNLDDMLFKYGVRVNPVLIQDLNSGYIPMVTGFLGKNPQTQMLNWKYFPLLNNFGDHPIVKNMDAVYGKFVGTLDTVKAKNINKIPLIFSSQYSKTTAAPMNINLNQARANADPYTFNQGKLPVAILLEGKFASSFSNRPSPIENKTIASTSQSSKIIVCSDGDLLRNDLNKNGKEVYPLGYDIYTRQKFANKDFALNSIDYLLDEKGLVNIRAKEITLRPLDKVRVDEERLSWQILNLIVPVVLIIVFGILRYYVRKKKYENFKIDQSN